jgi:hypothetical protein
MGGSTTLLDSLFIFRCFKTSLGITRLLVMMSVRYLQPPNDHITRPLTVPRSQRK